MTTAFREALPASHQSVSRAEVIQAGVVIATLPITDGSVTLDSRAASRGRMDIQMVDDGTLGLVPTDALSLLAPYGNQVKVSRGIVDPDGVEDLYSLGVFRIDNAKVDDSPTGLLVSIGGLDQSAVVIDARFEDAYEVAAGTTVEAAILALIDEAIPDVVTSFPGITYTLPKLIAEEGGDRWKFAQDMAASCGLSLYFDGDGILTLAPLPGGEHVSSFVEGENGMLLTAGREWRREGSYNRVIATGESSSDTAPARGVATDDDPTSPTYYFGRFGKVPMFFTSPMIATNGQAADAAYGLLAKQLGTTETISFGAIVDPSLKPDDVVRISRVRAGIVEEDHVLDQIAVPLGAEGVMTGVTRARQVSGEV